MSEDLKLNPYLCPAHYIEKRAFNPKFQLENATQREVLARVVAVAAPFFYLFQICLHTALAPINWIWGLTGYPRRMNHYLPGLNSAICSTFCLFSSVIEIPQKLLFGSQNAPDYLGDKYENRYDIKDRDYQKPWRTADFFP